MKKMESDIVVIAAGISGLAAAITAAENDTSVIVFEKGGTTGGAASMGMGLFAVESHLQKEQMVSLTVEQAFNLFMEYNHWRPDANLVRNYYAKSGETIKWLEDMGVEFLGAYKYFPKSQQTWHVVKMRGSSRPAPSAASSIARAMTERASELGVQIHFNTSVYEIVMENGRATGVRARSKDGEDILVECDSVIVCTGGFGDNTDMIREKLGYEWGRDLFSFKIPGVAGDGMRMVWDVGGGKTPVNMELNYTSPGINFMAMTVSETVRQPNLMVNLNGKRIMNEEVMMNTTFTGNVITRQKNRTAFTIFDEAALDYYKKSGLDFITYHNKVESLDRFHSELELCIDPKPAEIPPDAAEGVPDMGGMLGLKTMFTADSIEDLAAQTGIDEAGLKETIAEYNEMCETGDTRFFKSKRYMKPISTPKFYAAQHFPSGYGSLGGIKTDDCMRVLTDDGDLIPGLYSAGTDACNIFGDSYAFIFPGSTMGFAINSGRIAGESAAKYLDAIYNED